VRVVVGRVERSVHCCSSHCLLLFVHCVVEFAESIG
jgi:hypothetical protein